MKNKDNKNLIIGIVVVVLILVLFGSFGFGSRNYGMMGSFGTSFIFLNWILNVLVIILIIIGIYWLINNLDYFKRRIR
ncbi:MAG: hypothetical protein AABY05_00800 [Nanoarchaeota archaeon]